MSTINLTECVIIAHDTTVARRETEQSVGMR